MSSAWRDDTRLAHSGGADWLLAELPLPTDDRLVQSIKLRASGADSFVEPLFSAHDSSLSSPSIMNMQQDSAMGIDVLDSPNGWLQSPGHRSDRPMAERMNTRSRDTATKATSTGTTGDGRTTKTKRVRVKTERRREQCRANQARYRNKQRAFRADLEETVNELRDEVRALEAQKRSLSYGLRTKLSPWNVVVEFFRIFRHGVHLHSTAARWTTDGARNLRGVEAMKHSPDSQEQLAFLQSVVARDVRLGPLRGIDALAEQMVHYSRCYEAMEVHLERMEEVRVLPGTLEASARMLVTVSDATVRFLYPHLLGQGELGWRLCGQRLEYKLRLSFECDPVSSQVLSLRAQMDPVRPLLRVLGSLVDVARVLDGARVTCEGVIDPLERRPTGSESHEKSGEDDDDDEDEWVSGHRDGSESDETDR